MKNSEKLLNFIKNLTLKQKLTVAAIPVVIILGIIIITHVNEKKNEEIIAKGISTLAAAEKKDLSQIEDKIKTQRATAYGGNYEDDLDGASKSVKSRFSDTIILGDSLVEGFYDYELIDQSSVISVEGGKLSDCESDVSKAISLVPEKIVLSFGFDDVGKENAAEFKSSYENVISSIREELPGTDIYICGALQISTDLEVLNNAYNITGEYNEALKEICEDVSLNYIDISSISRQYNDNRYYPDYEFYDKWVDLLVRELDI